MSKMISLSNKFRVTETGLIVTQPLTFEEWEQAGKQISNSVRSVERAKTVLRRCFGDWVCWGEANYHELASQCFEADMYAMGTLRNAIYACRNVAPENRVEGLGIDYDIEVARIPHEAQNEWLKKALDEGWTVRELRVELRKKYPSKRVGKTYTGFEDWFADNEKALAQKEGERESAKFCFEAGRSVERGEAGRG